MYIELKNKGKLLYIMNFTNQDEFNKYISDIEEKLQYLLVTTSSNFKNRKIIYKELNIILEKLKSRITKKYSDDLTGISTILFENEIAPFNNYINLINLNYENALLKEIIQTRKDFNKTITMFEI